MTKKNPIQEARRYVENAYEEAVSKRDKKLLGWVTDGYQILHLYMNYDGIQSKKTCDDGFCIANNIIDHCEKLMA